MERESPKQPTSTVDCHIINTFNTPPPLNPEYRNTKYEDYKIVLKWFVN